MESLGLKSKKLKKYTRISEYCAMLKSLGDTAQEILIEKGGAVLAKDDDLTGCIKFIQEKLNDCYKKGVEIIDLLKK